MNPSAGEWKPSAAAPSFTPPTPPPPKATSSVSDIDENDPLWQLVLNKICNGDRERATKLINNPATSYRLIQPIE